MAALKRANAFVIDCVKSLAGGRVCNNVARQQQSATRWRQRRGTIKEMIVDKNEARKFNSLAHKE